MGFALSLFGLVATIGLATYNARNDQLYFELVGRAAAIERSLDLPDGAFANRPGTWQRVGLPGMEWKIDHGTAVRTIYGASIALWLFGAVAFVLWFCRLAYVDDGLEVLPPAGSWARAILFTAAILIVVADPIVATFWGGRRKEARQKTMACLARYAMEAAEKQVRSEAEECHEFLQRCAADQGNGGFVRKCMDLAKYAQDGRKKEKIEAEVRARAGFYASRDAECLGYYVPQGSWDLSASHLIGLLTDLSPLWIHDCWTNRKGSVPIERCDEAKRQDPTGTRAAGASGEHDREGAGQ